MKIYYLITESEVIAGKSQTEGTSSIHQSLRSERLRFPCNDRVDEVNKLLIIWPFHYGPEPGINENQQLHGQKIT